LEYHKNKGNVKTLAGTLSTGYPQPELSIRGRRRGQGFCAARKPRAGERTSFKTMQNFRRISLTQTPYFSIFYTEEKNF
jgi:hypothetical protein